jgi:cation diffusion facilitator family transporter
MSSSNHGSPARAILYAFLANFGIAVTKGGAAIYTNSGSMLAEAIHSVADCLNQVLLFVGLKRSEKPPTAQHPVGHGKASYFWSFIVALMLFSMGGLFSIYEGVHKLREPEPLNQAWVALVVLAVAIALETASLLGCLREIRKTRGTRRFGTWLRHTRAAELVVVLGEDIAALVGLVLAFGFVGLAASTGDTRYDAAGSIAIGVVLIAVALFIAVRISSLLLGKSADPELRAAIDELIAADPAIERLLNTITLQFGPKVLLAAKIRMCPDLTVVQAAERINELERELKARFPEVGWCFVEPDLTD